MKTATSAISSSSLFVSSSSHQHQHQQWQSRQQQIFVCTMCNVHACAIKQMHMQYGVHARTHKCIWSITSYVITIVANWITVYSINILVSSQPSIYLNYVALNSIPFCYTTFIHTFSTHSLALTHTHTNPGLSVYLFIYLHVCVCMMQRWRGIWWHLSDECGGAQ